MKPKRIMCPICGKKMWATAWGMIRDLRWSLNRNAYPALPDNTVNYECSCGCVLYYKGTKSCWEEEE